LPNVFEIYTGENILSTDTVDDLIFDLLANRIDRSFFVPDHLAHPAAIQNYRSDYWIDL
jgi:hypothetical protein